MWPRRRFSERWQDNEAELNRLYALGNRVRESDRLRISQLGKEQDRIEWQLGREEMLAPVRKWSGMP
jgi:hypothetical protein